MDDVLRFLLDQVALCGKSGAYPSEVFDFLKSYSPTSGDQISAEGETFPGTEVPTLDHTLLTASTESAVWSWLTRHPGLFVGKNGHANHLTLDEVRSQNESTTAACRAEHENGPEADLRSLHCSTSEDSPILKLYATEEHVWNAVAGHGIDSSRIPPRDFDCLCVIAQHRESGIIQPTLVKLTGQDARSVPMRTQRLCDAGYVIKAPTMTNGMRSSLLILKRFASWMQREVLEAAGNVEGVDSRAPSTPARLGKTKHGEHENQIREALAIVKDTQLVAWDDLKKKIGIFHDGAQAKAVATAFRDLEQLGIVQRVKAQGTQDTHESRYHRCIKFLRNPTAIELSKFFSTEHVAGRGAPAKDSVLEDPRLNTTMREIPRIRWNASRQLTHIIRDTVDAAGPEGLTLQSIKESAVGLTYDRPIDHLLGRLVDSPNTSQPMHLRHLGLIRDTVAIGRSNMYIHYAAHRLESLLQAKKISDDSGLTDVSRPLSVDTFGFTPIDKAALKPQTQAKFLSQRASVSRQSINEHGQIQPLNTISKSGRPRGRPRKNAQPEDAIPKSSRPRGRPRKNAQPEDATPKSGRPRGRPRKNAQGPNATVAVPTAAAPATLENSDGAWSQTFATLNIENSPSQPGTSRRRTTRPNGSDEFGTIEASVEIGAALTYPEQSVLIQRPSNGIFVGQFFELRRPGLRGRRPKSRLAIIKTPKLMDFPWFTTSSPKQSEIPIKPLLGQVSSKNEVAPRYASDAAEREVLATGLLDAAQGQPPYPNCNTSYSDDSSTSDVIHLEAEANGASTGNEGIEDQNSVSSTKATTEKLTRTHVGGGAVAAKRRQIILEIVNNADGLYPGGNELWYPFTTMWQQYNRGAQPDGRTVKNSASSLVDSGALHRVTFNFQNRLGIVTVKTILTLPTIDPEDERVQNLQEKMIAADPRHYFPESIYIAPELKPYVKRPENQLQPVPIEEEKVDLQYIPAYLRKRKASQAGAEGSTTVKKKRKRQSERNKSIDTDGENSLSHSTPSRSKPYIGAVGSATVDAPYSTYQPDNEALRFAHFPVSWEPSIDAIEVIEARQPSPTPVTLETPRKKRAPPRQAPKPRRLASLMDKRRLPLPVPTENQAVFKKMRARGPQSGVSGSGWELRMYTATLIAQALLGGLERTIDWGVVTSMLNDGVSTERVQSKWNHVRNLFRQMGDTMNDELREKLAQGFEDDSLASIDYDDLQAYDWKELLDWTMRHIDPSRFDGGLPTTRARLLERYDISINPGQTLDTFYDDAITVTLPQRRAILHKHAYVEDLTLKSNTKAIDRLSLARSWVHAVMSTPEAEYDAEAATAKLALLTEDELLTTVKNLRTEKMVTNENKGRLFPGRGYDFSDRYTSKLNTNIEVDKLREAAKFKKMLDSDFGSSGRSHFDLNGRDGAFLALNNMIGHGQVRTNHGSKLPKGSSLVGTGYVTRKMDKSRLIFGFDVEPTDRFRSGNPLDMSVEPPHCQPNFVNSGAERVDLTMIPMWYDMNGKIVSIMWEVARAIVALQLSFRPGITVPRLANTVKSFLQAFEVELVLRWFVDIGAAEYVDEQQGNVVLREWWWMMLADAVG